MKLRFSAAVLACSLIVSTVQGQDDPPPQQVEGVQKRAIIVASPESGGDGPQAIQIQSFEFSGDGAGPHMLSFSADMSDPMMGMSVGGGNTGLMNLLQNKSIRDEIELVDDQYKKMQDFYKERQSGIMKEVQSLIRPTLSGDGKANNRSVQLRGKKIKEMIQKQQAEAEEKLKDLLLPHQIKRLEQVSHQVKMKNAGTLNALVSGKLKDELELTDDDIDNLKEKSKSIEKRLNEEIAKLRAKAKKDLLNELSGKQRRKLDELMGDEFEYKPSDWRSRLKEIQNRVGKKSEDK